LFEAGLCPAFFLAGRFDLSLSPQVLRQYVTRLRSGPVNRYGARKLPSLLHVCQHDRFVIDSDCGCK
jgi:hypothetical protein